MRLRLLLCVMLLLGLPPARATEPAVQPEVLWLGVDFKPLIIKDGPQAGEGFLDKTLLLFQQLLPGYRHLSTLSNTSRREQEMLAALREGRRVCSVALLRTPKREAFAVFSRPYLSFLPNGIITLQRLAPSFAPYRDGAGDLQLARILADSQLRLGVSRDRIYGGAVDALLAPLATSESNPAVVWRAAADIGEGLYGMLQRGRIDFTLGYSVEEQYLERQVPGQEPTVFLPLAENASVLEASLSCARTPWGEQAVAHVDSLLADPALRDQFQAFYEEWLNPESLQLYRAKLATHKADGQP
jgi:uncharacterized protein (TIGR02285 family)